MSLDSFRDALIRCMREGRLNHVIREDLEEKNHMAVGAYFRQGVAWLASCHPSTRKNP